MAKITNFLKNAKEQTWPMKAKIEMLMSLNRIQKGGRVSQQKRPPLEGAFFVGINIHVCCVHSQAEKVIAPEFCFSYTFFLTISPSSSSCACAIGAGASIMTSLPALFFGKAI